MISRGAIGLWLALAAPALAYDRPLTGPLLGAASDFGQRWSPDMLAGATALPLPLFRDEVFWANVETNRGRFLFDTPRTTYPDLFPDQAAGLLFLANNPHPNHDGGATPSTDAGLAAFATYAATVAQRFPDIKLVEIGNEMNSPTFAWGPGWEGDITQRADSYVRLLAATATAVRAARPGVTILGGAAHSIPLAWFREVFAKGAAQYLDEVVIHPYTVAPEQLARQIALLRADVPEVANLPLAVTEFGEKDAASAPAYLVKSYCQQALSGVAHSVWYPLNPRGDGIAPLLDERGGLTRVGETFRFLRAHWEGKAVEDIAPDPFTFGCRFGEGEMVLWGASRSVTLAEGVQALDLAGMPMVAPVELSPDVPLILTSASPLRLGQEVRLGPSGVLADSWTQFGYPGATADPFERLVRQNGQDSPLTLFPGQERDGVPWTPYLGTEIDGVARASAEWVLPSAPPAGPIDIVTRYRVPAAVKARVEVRLAPWDGGIALTVTLNGVALQQVAVAEAQTVTLGPLALKAGDVVEVVAAPNGSGGGAGLRVILTEATD